ncbi:hypothetical protein OKW21_006073 [Catalinimonas alkaloidigena]|uniref:hypothetical protein n=1 Tax=Catalinimonas alkaloidigena TaxID=1075417 RepID=UPI002406D88F|nr:hypothetical protein [Catalinimonas alkaloidigena]MDF9800810.1 hypothetical protein [Catalinimonas alkaloidigena]
MIQQLIRKNVSGSTGGGEGNEVEKPAVPSLNATGGQNKITLSFDSAPDNVTNRSIKVSSDGENYSTLVSSNDGSSFTLQSTSYVHEPLLNNELKYYRLEDSNSAGTTPSAVKFARTNPVQNTTNGFSTAVLQQVNVLDTGSSAHQIELVFDRAISLTNSEGFRLLECSARIKNLASGSNTNRLVFTLTDHLLPWDELSVLYWQEIGNATASDGKLAYQKIENINNPVSTYYGTGDVYFVASNGNDGSGQANNINQPYRWPNAALADAQAGDYVLLRRGDTFVQSVRFPRNGQANNYITLSAYGTGNKPVVRNEGDVDPGSNNARGPGTGVATPDQQRFLKTNGTSIIIDKDYINVNAIHIDCDNGGGEAITMMDYCVDPIVGNCFVDSSNNSASKGILIGRPANACHNPYVYNNECQRFNWGIRSSTDNWGFRLKADGTPRHEVFGGLVEYNRCLITRRDCMGLLRGNYHGLIYRKNTISGWDQDGVDHFAAWNLINEYTHAYSPANGTGSAIKAGGTSGNYDSQQGGTQGISGRDVIVRYAYVHDIENSSGNGFGITNNNNIRGKIYGCLVIGAKNSGIKISGSIERYDLYNNTLLKITGNALDTYTAGGNGDKVFMYNNICDGADYDIKHNGPGSATARNNILKNGTTNGSLNTSNNVTVSNFSTLFENYTNTSSGDYHLKSTASQAIDTGFDVSSFGYDQDYEGKDSSAPFDIGCYDHASTTTLNQTTIWGLGDSTMKLTGAKAGWGEYFQNYLRPEATWINKSDSGESTASFRNESQFYDSFKNQISTGHYCIIQFGHNDKYSTTKSTTVSEFRENLEFFVTDIRNRGAIPILVTPVERMIFSNGEITSSHDPYHEEVIKVATGHTGGSVTYLDLQQLSFATFGFAGENNVRNDFASPDYPPSGTDETHFGRGENAERVTKMVVSLINDSSSGIKNYIQSGWSNFTWNPSNYA